MMKGFAGLSGSRASRDARGLKQVVKRYGATPETCRASRDARGLKREGKRPLRAHAAVARRAWIETICGSRSPALSESRVARRAWIETIKRR